MKDKERYLSSGKALTLWLRELLCSFLLLFLAKGEYKGHYQVSKIVAGSE